MARVFAQEDGNLNVRPVTTSRKKSYQDIDLTFSNKPSGDVYKKTDAAAVKQAVKNILLTNAGEKPFRSDYGADLNRFLFDLNYMDDFELKDVIGSMIARYEPRARVREVQILNRPDEYSIDVLVRFQVVNVEETQQLNLSLTRLR